MTNDAAVKLGKLRWKGRSSEERADHARLMNEAKLTSMTPEQRSAAARKAAETRWGKKAPAKKKAAKTTRAKPS